MEKSLLKHKLAKYARELAPLLSVVLITVFFQIVCQGKLLTQKNLVVLVNQIFFTLLIAMGAIFVYAHGNMDISLGGMFGVAMLLGAIVTQAASSLLLGFLVIMVFCTVIGFINGVLQDNFRRLPFLPSLCMMFILSGILTFASNIKTFKISNDYAVYDNFIIKIAVILVCGAISYLLFNHTKIVKFNKAIGGNTVAAAQLGIHVTRYKVIAFTITGIYTGIAAFFGLLRTRSVSAESGAGLHFDVMIAIIYGGMALSGGSRSRFSAAVYGSIIVTILGNGLTMSGFSTGMVSLIKAIIFLILVYISSEKTKGALPR